MNTLLQRSPDEWRRIGGLDTAQEIAQQPAVWRALARQLGAEQGRVTAFLGCWLAQTGHRVILTGAGSSHFVGELVADDINAGWPAQVRAVATTSLLTHPELYLDAQAPTLLVSFARSGNSPESLAAVELVRATVPQARFLNITCNAEGRLARQAEGQADCCNLMMPAASCDRGFAMTSSFSCMLLAALVVLGHGSLQAIGQIAASAEQALEQWEAPCAQLGAQGFERIVYLGSGPLQSLAREAALKVLELSGGRALALADTPLGFRHGPKSVLNQASLVVLFHSGQALAQRYEHDLLTELRREQVAGHCLALGPENSGADLCANTPVLSDAWLAPLWLLFAQSFALHHSAALGLTPDNPFADGTVNRVVQGVTIYRNAHD